MSPAPDVVYFDLDGVVIDSRPAIGTCLNAALRSFGFAPLAGGALDAVIGPPLAWSIARVVAERGGDPALAPEVLRRYREAYAGESLRATVLQPGIVELLDALAPRATLAVATSKPLRFARPILEALGIAGRFAAIEGPGADGDAESKTETLGRAIASIASASASGRGEAVHGAGAAGVAGAWMIGDRSHDMLAATAHGVVGIGALWGYGGERELLDAGAAALAAHPRDVLALVASPASAAIATTTVR